MTADEEKHVGSETLAAQSDAVVGAVSNEQNIPAQDGGRQAWLCLAGAAVIDIVIWGK